MTDKLPGSAPLRVLLAASLLSGCTVGPNYHPPETAVPATFLEPQAVVPPGATVDPARWWQAFNDPLLTSLVERSLRDNPDIAVAASRVRQARYQEIQARAVDRPTVDAMASASHVEFSRNAGFATLARSFGGGGGGSGSGGGGSTPSETGNGGVALPGSGITTYALGFDASWELDLFGGGRRGVEGARARTAAAVWNRRDAAVTLAAEIADAYFAWRLDQDQAAVIESEIARQQRALEIANHVAQVGLQPQVDVTRQRGTLTSLQARLQPIRADQQVRLHALGLLVGQAPEALATELAGPLPALAPLPVVPAGLPSDLLRRRPDVREAERNLAGATADIGVAVADQFPRFTLTGVAELLSTALRTLFSGDSLQLSGTGAAQFPLLDWGRRRATVGVRREDREQAYQQYRQTVLQALRDVEDALARLEAERQRHVSLAQAVADAEATVRSVSAQYRTGLIAQDSLINAEVQVLSAREQLAGSDAQLRQDTAALYKALGGGWEEGTDPTSPARTPITPAPAGGASTR